ncbi:hypothetical protein LP52_01665 [Streptomonospora alba]|uniref:Uncharacterized protein n=1 Tax=Streptomonospora alba TaxID=183763 RepID=A0A0C2JTR2_9ACTN|nr:hypothetical protein [Streptomonospora alba]KII00303.1 hypothetical protein LP52_01665 [Streptomonospora alba]
MDRPELKNRDPANTEPLVSDHQSRLRGRPADTSTLVGLFCDADGQVDALHWAQLLSGGRARAERTIHGLCLEHGAEEPLAERVSRAVVESLLGREVQVSGAEAIAVTLADAGVHSVFAYAGTSELAVCDVIARTAVVRLVHGSGAKESAFFAAGESRPADPARIHAWDAGRRHQDQVLRAAFGNIGSGEDLKSKRNGRR